jgi:4-hydroxybenzoate polyprenyltransferase
LPKKGNGDSFVIAMRKFFSKIEHLLDTTFEQKVGILSWLLGFSGIIALRIFIDFFLASKALPIPLIIIEYVHNFLFFSISIIFIWLILSFFLTVNPQKLSKLLFWSLWGILLPPLVDMLKTGGEVFWSFYVIGGPKFLISQYLTFLSDLPSGIVYFGTKVLFMLAVIFSGLVVYLKTKNWWRTIFSSLLVYLVLFVMGAAPSLISFGYYFFDKTKRVSELQPYQIVQLFAFPTPIFGVIFDNLEYSFPYNLQLVLFPFLLMALGCLFFASDRLKFMALVKNFRLPQIIYHAGLFFVGLGLAAWIYRSNFSLNLFSIFAAFDLLFCVILAWAASVVPNDLADTQVDSISNPHRPLQQEIISRELYSEIGWVLFFLSIFGALLVNVKFAALLLVYQFLAFTYSAWPYRLKRFIFVASFVSACASLIIFFSGFALVSGDQNIQGLPWRVIFLLLFCYTVSLPIKDFKDIAGDARDGVRTVPVVFGEEKGRIIVASGFFISFILSVFLLNEKRLFWWALLFGSLAFIIMTNKKIHPRKVFWWILAVVSLYGMILVKVAFELTF